MLASLAVMALAAVAEARHCRNITVPVSISATNHVYTLKPLATEVDVTNFFLGMARPGADMMKFSAGNKTVSGSYKLAATYCEPDSGPGPVLQVLTHGVGFDRSYWDIPLDSYYYSYVNRALEAGHSTLSWDRLGIAQSSHGDPINEIQAPLEVAALKALTEQAKEGHLCGVQHKFDKTVHVGHSFGSALSFALTAANPDITDAIVLTGFSQVSDFMPLFLLGGNFAPVSSVPSLADHYAAGYIAPKNSIGVHINFFGADDFRPDALQYATQNGQPAALGELLSLGGAGMTSNFTGSVLIITGDADIPFCGGNCTNTKAIMNKAPNLIENSKDNFKKAKAFNATIIPKSGHGLNYGLSAPTTYKAITDFIKAQL